MRNFLLVLMLFSSGAIAQTGWQNYSLKVADSARLSQPTINTTVNILAKRLQKWNYKNSSVTYNKAANRFVITGTDVVDTNFIKFWLAKPFRINIYETYSIQDISDFVLSKNRTQQTVKLQNEFLKLLHINEEINYRHKLSYIGTLLLADTAKFNKLKTALKQHFPADLVFLYPKKLSSPEAAYVEVYAVRNNPAKMSVNEMLDTCASAVDDQRHANVNITFNKAGQRFFSKLTAGNVNRALAIAVDDRVYSAPFVAGPVPGNIMQVAGAFSVDETKEMADIFLSGCLPVKLTWLRSDQR